MEGVTVETPASKISPQPKSSKKPTTKKLMNTAGIEKSRSVVPRRVTRSSSLLTDPDFIVGSDEEDLGVSGKVAVDIPQTDVIASSSDEEPLGKRILRSGKGRKKTERKRRETVEEKAEVADKSVEVPASEGVEREVPILPDPDQTGGVGVPDLLGEKVQLTGKSPQTVDMRGEDKIQEMVRLTPEKSHPKADLVDAHAPLETVDTHVTPLTQANSGISSNFNIGDDSLSDGGTQSKYNVEDKTYESDKPDCFVDNDSVFVLTQSSPKSRIFTPKTAPPSKADVLLTLFECEELESTGVTPFYSNIKDSTKRLEVGSKVLKLDHRYADLKTHRSSLNIVGIEDMRKALLGGDDIPRAALIEDRHVVLTPLEKPPTRKEILGWTQQPEITKSVEKTKLKVLMPGGDESDSADESLTLTPCTPSVLSDASPVGTPASALHHLPSPDVTPVVASPDGIPAPASSPDVTPVAGASSTPHQKPRRRVSFEGVTASASPSISPSSVLRQSTPLGRRRSLSPGLMTIDEEGLTLKKGPLSRIKGRRRLIMRKLSDARRASTDSNKSTDIFEHDSGEPQPGMKEKPPVEKKCLEPKERVETLTAKDRSCLIRGVSLDNTFGFKTSLHNFQDAKPSHDVSCTIFSYNFPLDSSSRQQSGFCGS